MCSPLKVIFLLLFFASFSQCRGFVYCVFVAFLVILTNFLGSRTKPGYIPSCRESNVILMLTELTGISPPSLLLSSITRAASRLLGESATTTNEATSVPEIEKKSYYLKIISAKLSLTHKSLLQQMTTVLYIFLKIRFDIF